MPQELINGYRMYYEVHGDGQPLVMIHGGLGGGEGCASLVEHHAAALADRFRLVFYDRRTAGRSETPSDGYSIANYARDLRRLLERLDVARSHVLGSSAGGPIAMQFTLDYPHMVETLLLINTMSYASQPERAVRQRELANLRAALGTQGKAVAAENLLEAQRPGLRQDQPDQFRNLLALNLERVEGIASTIQSYLDIGDSIQSRLSELAMPTLIVHGDADTRIPVDCAYQLHQLIPGSELHIIPGAEHGLMTNEARRMQELILEFVARQQSAVSQ